ncbi:Cellulose synthase [Quillaja saponaria]|uniref:Cellulose synthase n=1 Tax=Quillaja saponaria TaxID=32244 RepID=A0AAD7LAV2_QUISA|nr:Cellulose synthase [Quillaja saponaria]
MEDSLPLHVCHVNMLLLFINRTHTLLHSIALCFLIYYRASLFLQDPKTRTIPLLPWFTVFASELILSFIWILGQAYRWRPVSRIVFPERLPEDDKLPAIDVFICTTDPTKEPTVEVMNTVLSAMALDYPAEKLQVYLSDDGGSPITLHVMKEAWRFAKWWLHFCKKYSIETRCPKVYFSDSEKFAGDVVGSSEFIEDKQKIKEKYEYFKEGIMRVKEERKLIGDAPSLTASDHPCVIELIQENIKEEEKEGHVHLPLLVYVSREKRASHPHNFKAGALNVLHRVSSVISNSPYILVLDCDMVCNDPTSARQAMCFHLDSKISPSLAFVQFPQKFQNISKSDIYDSQLRSLFTVQWRGMDGLKGPVLSGTGFYMKREALCDRSIVKDTDLPELQKVFGSSNEFIKSLHPNHKAKLVTGGHELLKETQLLASCTYETGTKWGQEVGFLYDSVVEDFLTGFFLHCKGWTSVFCEPPRPHFLGSATINLNDSLIQGTRWSSGLFEVGLSKFCPLIYGPLRMSLLQSMCFAQLSYYPLYCLPLWCFAIIPQLCLVDGIPLYPKVSDPFFLVFVFLFVSALSQHLYEVLFLAGKSLQTWISEQRIWMIKSITCHLYGCLDAFMKKFGIRESSFLPTNKVEDDDQTVLYQMGKFDFRTSNMFLLPMLALLSINISSFLGGVYRMVAVGEWEELFIQAFLSAYIVIMNYSAGDKERQGQDFTISSSIIWYTCINHQFCILLGNKIMYKSSGVTFL